MAESVHAQLLEREGEDAIVERAIHSCALAAATLANPAAGEDEVVYRVVNARVALRSVSEVVGEERVRDGVLTELCRIEDRLEEGEDGD